jgi:hypothetical protein
MVASAIAVLLHAPLADRTTTEERSLGSRTSSYLGAGARVHRAGAMDAASAAIPSLPVVADESGEDLVWMKDVGFEVVGRSRVWVAKR